jgi:signal transduction histidine kinase/HAMP domain-containing protein
LFSKKISDPIVKLSETARKISEGEFTLDIDDNMVKKGDEIGSLAKSFRAMVLNLKEKIDEIEKRVKESDVANSELDKSKKAILNLLEDVENEKKKVEETVAIRTRELRDEKSRFLASINSLAIGFAIVENNGDVILSNPAISKILGFEIDVRSLNEISAKVKGEDLLTRLKECSDKKCVIELKEILLGSKYLRIFLTPVFSSDELKSSLGGVILVEDVTEAKVMERSRDEFFAVASHELRTPLTAIKGNVEMVLDMYMDKIVDKDMKEMLVDVDLASVRLIDIVNDFLEVSRLEQGRINIKKENFDIKPVISKAIDQLKGMAEKRNVALEFISSDTNTPEVFSDKMRISQVVVNLLGNAIKFTNSGSVKVFIEKTPGFLKITVTDTGIGIAEKNQNLLFRKFQQAGEQMLARDVTQGTGLGLYISKLIVSALGGTIGLVESIPGKGSSFAFTVPIVK